MINHTKTLLRIMILLLNQNLAFDTLGSWDVLLRPEERGQSDHAAIQFSSSQTVRTQKSRSALVKMSEMSFKKSSLKKYAWNVLSVASCVRMTLTIGSQPSES